MLHFQLRQFGGPLALLLYLIRKEEMDIFDINIHDITKQYLEHIQLMKEFDLEVAGDFVAMAATLIQIKSKMLLPQYNTMGEEVDIEDPRRVLVQKLLEYQKYQEVSKTLYERPLLGRDVWPRGGPCESLFDEGFIEETLIFEGDRLFSLIASYRKLIKRFKKSVHKIGNKVQSIASRVAEIAPFLKKGENLSMSTLITNLEQQRTQLLVTFLSILELAKLGMIRVFQTQNYGEIYINTLLDIDHSALERVGDYEAKGHEALAEKIMEEASENLTLEIQKEDEDEEESWLRAATDEEIEEEIHNEGLDDKLNEESIAHKVNSEVLSAEELLHESLSEETVRAQDSAREKSENLGNEMSGTMSGDTRREISGNMSGEKSGEVLL